MEGKIMKKALILLLVSVLPIFPLAAFAAVKEQSGTITVVSREDGSGTRGAFIELFGVLDKDKNDNTVGSAEITNSTSVMMTSIEGDKTAIGYISLGSLNDSVKAVKIDGVAASVENINNGGYKISRPFLIATKAGLNERAQGFINFIMSSEGQDVIEKNGYIRVKDSGAYKASRISGKVVVAGSSSVTPIMEKLKEAYVKVNPNADIEIQQSDSSTGMNAAIDGICDIGMASREIKESELNKGLNGTVIAIDGIAVIVNKENPVVSLTKDQVKSIFTGTVTKWPDIN
jgi:phosphate transport system substrate-binding protein